jgi:DNA-directed RNA polymerase specialized sigma24 family protein
VSPSDAELTSAAQAGERRALDELLRRHYDRIFGVCRRITGNDATLPTPPRRH